KTDGINGIILNPWNRTIMLDKQLIRIILGGN
ncbi:MAG: SseB family protein, partial [Lachnospiraceae bacterium]|nr:SseB family protein [Lachnospiraceae bacterium]